MERKSYKSYLFDLGDSGAGPIGMTMRLQAMDKEAAVTLATRALRLASGDCGQIAVKVPAEVQDVVESITIYVNPDGVSELDIFDKETAVELTAPIVFEAAEQIRSSHSRSALKANDA